MNLLDTLYFSDPLDSWKSFESLCDNPEITQKKVLKDILKHANQSEFFRSHNLNEKDNIENFRMKVKLSNWNDYEEFSQRMQNGEKNLLFNGLPELFVLTSGTLSKPKFIPETKNSLKAKSITEKLKQFFLLKNNKEIINGKVFPLVNKAVLGKTKCGIPFGTASGVTLANTPDHLKKLVAYPIEIISIKDDFSLDYLLMRFGLENDVRLIIGNNIARMEKLINIAKIYANVICNDIENGTIADFIKINNYELKKYLKPNPERAKELRKIFNEKDFLPYNYWKNLKVISCWLSSSVGIAIESVKKFFPEKTIYYDFGYGASEGKFNIPYKPFTSSGILSIHSCFYEFIPVNQEDKIILAHEVKKNELYKIVITTYSGLYRYDIGDIIKITGFFKNTPEIEFVSKAGDIGNIAGEKLYSDTIKNAIFFTANKLNINIKHFCAVKSYNPPHYIFCIELQDKTGIRNKEEFIKILDNKLKEDIGYGNRRKDEILKKPELKIMKSGWKDAFYREKRKKGFTEAQIKIPIIYSEIPYPEYILR